MNNKKRRVLHNLILEQQLEPYVALIFYKSSGETLQFTCTQTKDVAPPEEWKTLSGTIEICEGVESIAKEAFKGFSATSYTIPNSLKLIQDAAFVQSAVSNIDFTGKDECVLGGSMFYGCTNLESIYIPAATKSLRVAANYQSGMFDHCTALRNVQFGANEVIIGYNAFEGCTNLQLSQINTNEIGADAFKNCTSLTNLTINSSSRVYIGTQAFYNCSNLQSISFAASHILSGAFLGCRSLTTVKLTKPVTLQTQNNPDFIFCEYAGAPSIFSGCTSLNTIYFTTRGRSRDLMAIKNICGGESPFQDSTANNTYIYTSADPEFPNPTLITHWDFSFSSGNTFDEYLQNYTELTSIVIPATVATFAVLKVDNPNLAIITCQAETPPTVPQTAESYFFGNSIEHIYVPEGSVDAYKDAPGWSTYAEFIEAIPETT